MSNKSNFVARALSMAAVERDTGPGKDPLCPQRLGRLTAEAVLAVEGCRCASLGAQTPLWALVLAAGALRSNIVALSLSGCMNPNQLAAGLAELRAKLHATVTLWASGSARALHRRPVPGVPAFNTLSEVPAALQQLRRKG